jgi:pilus assembly protein CpaE
MANGANKKAVQASIVVVTGDADFEDLVRATFGASPLIGLDVVSGRVADCDAALDLEGATVLVVDVDGQDDGEMAAFERSVPPVELVRACARVSNAPRNGSSNNAAADNAIADETTEAQIFTFLPAVGGAGVTTLAVQTAMLLLNSGPRGKSATCLVDLDFQHGACADYLDIEPRLNLGEIEPRPERLDRQLLQVMLSQHASGLAVIAAPNRPAEMRSFDPDVVTRLLDLVSSHFDYVVFDMPRTWFSWTDSVLLGSNRLFIVSETTVPGLRQARQLVDAVRERLGEGPKPQVIINRFVQKLFSAGLRKSDIEQAIGDAFLSCIPNDYGLVREAIDRGVPLEEVKKGNKITLELKKLILPQSNAKPAKEEAGAGKKVTLSWARS